MITRGCRIYPSDFLIPDGYDGEVPMRLKPSRPFSPIACRALRQLRRRGLISGAAQAVPAVLLVILVAIPASAQFNSFRHDPRVILEGTWQSCQEKDGSYTERVYDHVVNGVGKFEVHMGPAHEFAIFPGVQDEHRAHTLEDNLLKPYRVPMVDGRAGHTWKIPSLGLIFTVALGGGSFTDCDNWYLTLAPDSSTPSQNQGSGDGAP
jgi:hypothetical protein